MSDVRHAFDPMALASPATRVGRFAYSAVAGTWEWDDELFRILGLQPWSITPTVESLLSCKHPEDSTRVCDVLVRAASDGKPFSVSYWLAGADGVERRVVVVGQSETCRGRSCCVAINGYCIDLTADFGQDHAVVVGPPVLESARQRSTDDALLHDVSATETPRRRSR